MNANEEGDWVGENTTTPLISTSRSAGRNKKIVWQCLSSRIPPPDSKELILEGTYLPFATAMNFSLWGGKSVQLFALSNCLWAPKWWGLTK